MGMHEKNGIFGIKRKFHVLDVDNCKSKKIDVSIDLMSNLLINFDS